MFPYALSSHGVDNVIFRVADVLEVPVLLLALLALAVVIFELGVFIVEVRGRTGRRVDLESAADAARGALMAGDVQGASRAAAGVARSAPMAAALSVIIAHARVPGGEHRIRKALADFDFNSQQRLNRTRLLVRAGPALGLMGTLIPLSPALTGLAQGNVSRLSTNLRIAFSVTVLGLLVGAVAFGLSLYRDRMYGQDLSDLEYFAAVVSDPREIAGAKTAAAIGDGQKIPEASTAAVIGDRQKIPEASTAAAVSDRQRIPGGRDQ
jgi:biopolymer transport protein ExbB/TolQ